tara:strand:+ start:100 stop:576 length:477 start_codon:yes stop_codon:yes gene_type:complete
MGTPVDYDELFPGRFLKAGLFQGRKPTLLVTAVKTEKLPADDGEDEERGLLFFEQTEKQLIVNSTNGQCIMGIMNHILGEGKGRKVQSWVGHSFTFVSAKVKYKGKPVDGIRLHGSPDLDRDIKVEVILPKRKPVMMTMYATGKKSEPEQDREPGIEG